jgi:hypothetical protein
MTQHEPIAVRFENALEKRHKFVFPAVIMVVGLALFFIIWYTSLDDILVNHPAFDPFELLNYPLDIEYGVITVLFIALMLFLMLGAYVVCLVPLTLLVLAASKGMIVFWLSQDRVQIGSKFGGIQLVMRSMLPGLFGIGVGVNALPTLFPLTSIPLESWPASFTLIMVLYYGTIGMILGAALFPATWLTDDAGLVVQGLLTTPYRVPPRVDGVGNWLRSFFAGLTLFLYPLAMIRSIILPPFLAGTLLLLGFLLALFIILLGIPLAMMGLSIPLVLLTEALLPKVEGRIRSLARRMGAREVSFQDATVIETLPEE